MNADNVGKDPGREPREPCHVTGRSAPAAGLGEEADAWTNAALRPPSNLWSGQGAVTASVLVTRTNLPFLLRVSASSSPCASGHRGPVWGPSLGRTEPVQLPGRAHGHQAGHCRSASAPAAASTCLRGASRSFPGFVHADTCCARQTRKVVSQLILKQRLDHPSVWSVKPAGRLALTRTHYRIWVPEATLSN